jgi:uncharacterized protein (DUF2235 family)
LSDSGAGEPLWRLSAARFGRKHAQQQSVRQPTENPQANTPRKNIILLSDGTGNSAAKVWRTNVWRLFQSLDLTNSSQVAIYDDGVGSSSFKPLAALGGALGWGLKRNVLDLYAFLCRNYGPNAYIYAFGFSRGAFTIRVLLGLVNNQGLVPVMSEAQLRRDSRAAYRAYRRQRYRSNLNFLVAPIRALRDAVIEVWHRALGRSTYRQRRPSLRPRITFVGLWDTVAAYGLPIEEMTRGVSLWLWPLSLPDRQLSDNVERACHALALDDARTTFHPVLWSERGHKLPPLRPDGHCYIEDERLTQVWFAGVHSNVGGGYPDDSLSQVSLYWMMREAHARGLRFKADPPADPDALRWARSASDKDGRLYDSRHGLGGYYRYGPRKIYDLSHMRFSSNKDDEVTIDIPKIHCSAIERIINGAHAYAPIGFPAQYVVVDADRRILEGAKNSYEIPAQAIARSQVQEKVWDLVWWRRLTYFATLAASLYLVVFPLIHDPQQASETSSRFYLLTPIISAVALVLPSFANRWIDAYVASPAGLRWEPLPSLA